MAGSSLSAGSFGASWAGGSGFWWTGWGGQWWGKSSKPSSDAGGGESAGFALSFPWEAEVVDEVSGEAELGVGGEDEPHRSYMALTGSGPRRSTARPSTGGSPNARPSSTRNGSPTTDATAPSSPRCERSPQKPPNSCSTRTSDEPAEV